MPRKQRIEYAGACYHVLSRGNYRKDLFTVGNSGVAFERALFEVVERCGWELYAYVIMSNHFHLALGTPEPNLVVGMKWLQSTFATRFNRLHGERGHVFQGRYKSILVSEDRPMLGLVDYIHLNPVRARLCSVDNLGGYALGSYAYYCQKHSHPALQRGKVLGLLDLPDSHAGMKTYAEHLKLRDEADPKKREVLSSQYCRGWFLGTAEAKKELAGELCKRSGSIDWEGVDLKELNESRWESIVCEELKRQSIQPTAIAADAKGAQWKVRIACRLRKETTAPNPWIANRLQMGHPNYVSNLVTKANG